MSTIAGTPVEHDPREKPGGGKLNPVPHVVRIVVLRSDELTAADRRRASNGGHGLTAEELETGENILKGMAAPPPSDATAKKQKNMFKELKPTDIVVMGVEAASVRVVDKDDKAVPLDESGQPVPRSTADTRNSAVPNDSPTRKLFAHDDRHRDTVLRVWTESDTIEYRCEEAFEILEVKSVGWKIYGAPDNPFANKKPYKAQQVQGAKGGKPLWVWRSSRLPATANNQQYKMTFKIGDEKIDPDVVCGDPPPSP
jgi:hypothetical protein